MISIVCFKWHKEGYRSKFEGWHVDVLRDMFRRNTTVPHRFICITDDPTGIDDPEVIIHKLWDNPAPHYGSHTRPNCFYRLKMFSEQIRDLVGDKFLWIDLDAVITGNIDHILSDPAEFKIWRVDGERMPCNGSLVLHNTGKRKNIWENFDPSQVHAVNAFRVKTGFVGSDQAWIAQNLTDQDEFFGQKDGVYSFRCHIEKKLELPLDAKIVFFHGDNDPWRTEVKQKYPWVAKHYRRIQNVK